MLNGQADRDGVLATIRSELLDIFRDRAIDASALDEETRLADLGISSLDLAELVSNLESVFGVDPFERDVAITSIVTLGDLGDAYLAPGARRPDPLDDQLRAIGTGTRRP